MLRHKKQRAYILTLVMAIGIAAVAGRSSWPPALYAQEQAAAPAGQASFVHAPATVSPEWRERLTRMSDPSLRPPWLAADDLDGWRTLQRAQEAARMPAANAAVARYQPTIDERDLAGVPVLDIKPKGWRDNGKALVYAHGGNYVFFSSRSSLNSSVPVADATGLRVIVVDYTLAPIAKSDRVTDEVVAVLQALQGGTKEILLSNFIRLYRALDMTGVPATLDLYEGMPHVFQQLLPEAPEGRIALGKTKAFLDEHLGSYREGSKQ